MEHTPGYIEECHLKIKTEKHDNIESEDTSHQVDVFAVNPNVEIKNEELMDIANNDVQDEKVIVKKEPEEFVVTENQVHDEKADIKSSGFIHNCFPPCRSRFTRKCYLEIHLRRHSSVTHCPWCSKDFKSSKSYLNHLSQHLKSKAKEYKEETLFCYYCCTQHASKKALQLHARTYCTRNIKNRKKREEGRNRNKSTPEIIKYIPLLEDETTKADVKLEKVENVIEKYDGEFEDTPEYITISALTDLTSKEAREVETVADITIKKEVDDAVEYMDQEINTVKEEAEHIIDYESEENDVTKEKYGIGESEDIGELTINSDLWRTTAYYPACEVCGAKFRYMACKNIHEIVHNNPMECTLCNNKPIAKFREFRAHVYRHQKQKEAELKEIELQCPYCGLKFSNRKVVILHMRIHTNERPFKCDICGNAFKQRNSLNTHLVTHSKEKAFMCKECDGKYTTSSSLKRHIRKMHNMQRSIRCAHCSMTFQNVKAAKEHRMQSHVDKMFKRYCSLCNEHFFNKVSYTDHVKMHKSSL